MFLPEVKSSFVSRTQLLRPKHVPSLATMKTMLISFQCHSLIKKKPRQFCYETGIGPSLRSSFQPISIWAFLSDSFTFVVQTGYYHTQSSYFSAVLTPTRKGRAPCLHLHALCVALGTRKCKSFPRLLRKSVYHFTHA